MSKKYIKNEKGIVRAVTSENLQLEKPLLSDFYDINIHNSNMDKIDRAMQQTNGKITTLESDLCLSENTKHFTSGGKKKFSCKNGYIDNISIEGNTKILSSDNKEIQEGVIGAKIISVGQGDNIELLTKNNNETKQDKQIIPVTLRSLPNGTKDTIEKRGNRYVKVQRSIEITLDDTVEITNNPTTYDNHKLFNIYLFRDANLTYETNYIAIQTNNFYCSNFKTYDKSGSMGDTRGIRLSSLSTNNRYIAVAYVEKSVASSLNEFKAWLKSNPITIVVELKTPEIIELPNFNPQAYEGNTTFSVASGDIQAECEFEVTNSRGSEIGVLKDKVSSLSVLQSEMLTNKTTLEANINAIREVL